MARGSLTECPVAIFSNLTVCCKGEEDLSTQCILGRFAFFSTRVLQDTFWESWTGTSTPLVWRTKLWCSWNVISQFWPRARKYLVRQLVVPSSSGMTRFPKLMSFGPSEHIWSFLTSVSSKDGDHVSLPSRSQFLSFQQKCALSSTTSHKNGFKFPSSTCILSFTVCHSF